MTAVPAAIDAVIAAVQTALPGVQVFDGPPTDDEQNERVFVGWSRNNAATYVSDALTSFQNGVTERFTIPCTAVSWSGDIDMKARRDRAFAMVAAVSAALPGSSGLAAVNADAQIIISSYTPAQTSAGTQALVDFTVTVEAYI